MIADFKSLPELLDYFDTEDKCLSFLIEQRKGNFICPHCSNDKTYAFKSGKMWKCAKCRKQFSIKKGTIYEGSKLPMRTWFAGLYLFLSTKKSISSYNLAEQLNITQRTAWHMLQRIRNQFKSFDPTEGEQLTGIVQADETFVGGKNKNRHWDKKVPQSQGRAHIDKTPVLGLLQEEISETIERPHKVIPGKTVKEKIIYKQSIIKCRVIESTSAKEIHPIVKDLVEKGCIFVSDEWLAYYGLNTDYDHRIVDHRRGQYVSDDGATTNAVEGAWSGLKRSIIGIHHWVSRKHLHRYVVERDYKYNTRNMTAAERFHHYMTIKGSRLKYKDLINGDG